TETDLHNVAVLGGQLDQAAAVLPALADMQLSGPTSLTYTTPPLVAPLETVGPGALDVSLSSSDPYTDVYAVVADVWPDGTAYPVATGALRTLYPDVDQTRSLTDAQGRVVDPYNLYDTARPALPGTTREYQVEILPMGNTFGVGHRIRLYLLGSPLDQMGAPPGVNAVSLGGPTPSTLLLPSVNGPPRFAG
ncbi:MAG TPA: CocE/NonD family hydrolase C-terminal non-catalytic domain-containing protein, partial [Acidimicrobiales bacterium]|nr:CocE/NonD family hydrolase C-terminal non-catalytic domain-containing protein [Acidimicrobiales bacterium]